MTKEFHTHVDIVFAWLPVRLEDGSIAWLRRVERCRHILCWDRHFWYRPLGAAKRGEADHA